MNAVSVDPKTTTTTTKRKEPTGLLRNRISRLFRRTVYCSAPCLNDDLILDEFPRDNLFSQDFKDRVYLAEVERELAFFSKEIANKLAGGMNGEGVAYAFICWSCITSMRS